MKDKLQTGKICENYVLDLVSRIYTKNSQNSNTQMQQKHQCKPADNQIRKAKDMNRHFTKEDIEMSNKHFFRL